MSQKLKNKIMLITYPDSMGKDLKELKYVLDNYLKEAVAGIHLLPFYPSSADRGFCPTTYKEVSPEFGTWKDILALSDEYYMMYDYMINHLSDESEIFKDFLEKKDDSVYKDFFVRYRDFWENGEPSQKDLDKIYIRKEKPYVEVTFKDGSKEKLWSTFSDKQIDINCQRSEIAKEYMRENLKYLSDMGAAVIRLDAFAYATKKPGTNCFFVEPDVWKLIGECREILAPNHVEILPEIHENYFIQKKLEEKNYYTYDFQLPMLLLNAFFFKRTMYLKNWLKICPRKQFTTLDTHDGIGVVDVRYLMPDDEILKTKKKVFEINPGITEVYVRSSFQINFEKFDTYQINCTYFSALGSDENKYFMARAVQFFTPGIPQVYYVGLFAGENDFELFRKTGAHRDINRHYYTEKEIKKEFERPIVQKLNRLMKLRNNHAAFQGVFNLLPSDEYSLKIRWENGEEYAVLAADFEHDLCCIRYSENGEEKIFV